MVVERLYHYLHYSSPEDATPLTPIPFALTRSYSISLEASPYPDLRVEV